MCLTAARHDVGPAVIGIVVFSDLRGVHLGFGDAKCDRSRSPVGPRRRQYLRKANMEPNINVCLLRPSKSSMQITSCVYSTYRSGWWFLVLKLHYCFRSSTVGFVFGMLNMHLSGMTNLEGTCISSTNAKEP